MWRRLLYALFAGWVVSHSASAAPMGAPLIRRFYPSELGSAPEFFGLVVSADGLVYASGRGGLFEFDGQSWRNLTAGQGYCGAALKDSSENIYVGGNGKLFRLEPTPTGGWSRRDVLDPLGLPRSPSAPFFFAQRNPEDLSLWFSALGRLVRVDVRGDVGVISEAGLARLIPWDGRLLVRSTGATVSLGWAGNGRVEPLEAAEAAELEGIVAAASGPNGETMAFQVRGLRQFKGVRPVGPWRPIPELDPENVVICALRLDDERVVVGTQRGQALVLSNEGDWVETWTELDGLTGGGIRALRRDGQGGLWMATDNGLARVQVDSPLRAISLRRGLRSPVFRMCRHQGRLWAGTSTGAWRQNEAGLFELQHSLPVSVRGFCRDGDSLIVSGRSLVVLRPDGTTVALAVPTDFAGLGDPVIDPSGQVMVVGTIGAVLQFRREGDTWVRAANLPDLTGGYVDLVFAPDGGLWMLNLRTRVLRIPWQSGSGPTGPPESVPSPEPGAAYEPEFHLDVWRGQVVVGSRAGLHRWNASAQRWEQADDLGPRARQPLSKIRATADGALWAVTGLSDETAQDKEAWRATISEREGSGRLAEVKDFQVVALRPHSATDLYADDGKHLILYGEGPIGILEAERPAGPLRIPPPVRIRRLAAAGVVRWEGGNSESRPTLALPAGERDVIVEISAPWYPVDSLGRSTLSFRTRLVGQSDAWTHWGNDLKREFSNLAPGTYRFEAQANVVQSAGPAGIGTLVFTVPAFWWETLWARVGFGLAALALVALAMRYFSQRLLRRKVEALEREARVEQERLRIARDMHDDLGSSLANIVVGTQRLKGECRTPRGEELAERIHRSAIEVMGAARDIIWAVNPQNDSLDTLAEYLSNWVHQALSDGGVDCRLDIQYDLPEVSISGPVRNGLLLATKEACHNVLKHSRARRTRYSICLEGQEAVFALTDDGSGVGSGKTPIPGSGVGLRSMHARLISIGGSASISNLGSGGTAVIFRLPVATPPSRRAG